MTTTCRFVWTVRAVDRYLRTGTYDPRHTNSNLEIDLNSPWLIQDMDRRANNSPWLLIDDRGVVVARA